MIHIDCWINFTLLRRFRWGISPRKFTSSNLNENSTTSPPLRLSVTGSCTLLRQSRGCHARLTLWVLSGRHALKRLRHLWVLPELLPKLLHLTWSLLHIRGLNRGLDRVALLVGWHLIVHDLARLRFHVCLAWRWHNSAVANHILHDFGSKLLSVLAGCATAVAMGVNASPHE